MLKDFGPDSWTMVAEMVAHLATLVKEWLAINQKLRVALDMVL